MGVVVLQQLGCSAVASRLAQLVALQYRRLHTCDERTGNLSWID
eukprot:COSAG01_NODE_1561_length_9917_cov_5.742514_13_plen_44_part_00